MAVVARPTLQMKGGSRGASRPAPSSTQQKHTLTLEHLADWGCMLGLYDPTNANLNFNLEVNFYGRLEQDVPVVQDGDIIVIQNLNVRFSLSLASPPRSGGRSLTRSSVLAVEEGQRHAHCLQRQGPLLRPSLGKAPRRHQARQLQAAAVPQRVAHRCRAVVRPRGRPVGQEERAPRARARSSCGRQRRGATGLGHRRRESEERDVRSRRRRPSARHGRAGLRRHFLRPPGRGAFSLSSGCVSTHN